MAANQSSALRSRPVMLMAVLTICVVTVTGSSVALLYEAAFEQQRERLVEVVKSQAELIQAVGRFDALHSRADHPEGPAAATLSQLRDAHRRFRGFGNTGEFTLARLEGDEIVFLLSHRHGDLDSPRPVPLGASIAEPMRRALRGESGTLVGLDYRGERVLAAHEPLPELEWGIVAKIDLSEIRQPFIAAVVIASYVGLVLIGIATLVFFFMTTPIVRRLEDSERDLRSVIDTAVDGIICIDPAGRVLTFNRAAEEMFGYTAEEVVGQNVKMLMPEPTRSQHDRYLRHYLVTGENKAIGSKREVESRRKDGTLFPMQLAVSQITDASSEVISFTGIVRDITEEKAMQEELRRHAAVFHYAKEAIMIMDADSRISQVNQAFTDLTGFSEQEVIGQRPGILFDERHDQAFYAAMQSALEKEGRWQGDIWARSRSGEVFPVWVTTTAVRDEADKIHQYIRMFTDISQRKLVEDHMRFLAHHDVLTGLANRSLFMERCEHSLIRERRHGGRIAILFMDLDGFKPVNDEFGHAVGDELLCAVAKRLQEQVRNEDTLARVGGDEFTILLEQVSRPEDAVMVAGKLVEAFDRPFDIRDHQLRVGISIGISIFPDHGDDVTSLVKRADEAMYQAKDQGRNRYVRYAG